MPNPKHYQICSLEVSPHSALYSRSFQLAAANQTSQPAIRSKMVASAKELKRAELLKAGPLSLALHGLPPAIAQRQYIRP